MNFIIITGPQAVGKMTVGQELVKIFDYSRDSFRKLNEKFRM